MRAWTVAEHSRATGDSSRTGAPAVASATPPPCLQDVGDVRAVGTGEKLVLAKFRCRSSRDAAAVASAC